MYDMRLGIDIGGTTITVGSVENGVLKSISTSPSFRPGAALEETGEYLCSLIKERLDGSVTSIGIGVPSVVDTERGIVYNAANIPSWEEFHIKEFIESRLGVPVKVDNDANCFAIGAFRQAGCNERDTMVGITLGTGVGIGIVVEGRIMRGANTGAGELSWLPHEGDSLEHWCSKGFFTSRRIDPRELCGLADAGDQNALKLFGEFGGHMSTLLTLVLCAYDPSVIVFGGGLSNCSRHFEHTMLSAVKGAFPFPKSLEKLKIHYMSDPEIAILGAALL